MRTPDEIKKGLEWDEVDKALQKVSFDDADEDDTRKPKTSDDIKQGLHRCSKEGCGGCPYEEDCFETDEPFSDLAKDSLALIQQLEAERDAAVENIRGDCVYCLHMCEDMVAPSCFDCANKGFYRWEWRGVQKEE